jgi:phosphatidylglycerophosphate synthase
MFDNYMRRVKESTFTPLARPVAMLPPWAFSVFGLLVGLTAALALWREMYLAGLLLWLLNRICDGLDGTVARLQGNESDFGGYLDIIFDFVIYAAIPIGLALGAADGGATDPVLLALIILLSAYYVNGASWMYLAAILEKRRHEDHGRLTSVTMPAGIIGGTETIIFYCAFILFPGFLVWLFGLMSLLTGITIVQRLIWAAREL